MTTQRKIRSGDPDETITWARRILILAIAGIILLTLYPFRFSVAGGARSPFLLGESDKTYGSLDALLNILLFAPFGFGFCAVLRKRVRSRFALAAMTLAAGAFFSYLIEFAQFFIPERDSGWSDVVTNGTGALVGALIFLFCGRALLSCVAYVEERIEGLATRRNTAIALLIYFLAWFGLSARLQKDTALSNWGSGALLAVGNGAIGRDWSAWHGQIDRLEFWDRALPNDVVSELSAAGDADPNSLDALVNYDLSGAPPYRDRAGFLPDLEWAPARARLGDTPGLVWRGSAWVATSGPVSALTARLRRTNQFSLRLRCEPTHVEKVWAGMAAISQPGVLDMELWQENDGVNFWFRTPISARRSHLVWKVPRVFIAGQPRDLLFSYDGSRLALFVDGKPWGGFYHLGPATRLAELVRTAKTSELDGYRYVFYILIFAPAGCALGWMRRRPDANRLAVALIVVAACLLPPALLELVLVRVGGQPISRGNIVLGMVMTLAGLLWIGVGRKSTTQASNELAVQADSR
jgi:VanZ family protein